MRYACSSLILTLMVVYVTQLSDGRQSEHFVNTRLPYATDLAAASSESSYSSAGPFLGAIFTERLGQKKHKAQ